MSFRFSQDVEIITKNGKNFLFSQKPLRLLRLNDSLTLLLKSIRDSTPWHRTADSINILNRIFEMGFLECQEEAAAKPSQFPSVSVVIPVKDRAGELQRCLASLSSLDYPAENIEVIVVDDGSSDNSMETAKNRGAIVIPSGGAGLGPSVARNVGAATAKGDILAFIDSDCTASAQWLNDLIPVFSDHLVAAVGGKVEGLNSSSPLDRYEAAMSSLSLGSRKHSAKDGQDTFYLPGCNLLIRRNIFQELHGFKKTLRVGEDVDLSYRLRDRRWQIVYLPKGTIYHEHRNRYTSFMARRFDYGTSEAILQKRHPGRKKRMAIPQFPAAMLLAGLTTPVTGVWGFFAALLCLMFDTYIHGKKIEHLGVQISFTNILSARIRTLGSLFYYVSFHLLRYYSIAVFFLCLLFPPLIPIGVAIFACASIVDYAVKKPKLLYPTFGGIYLLEQIAYGIGVFWGSLNHRSFANYCVKIVKQTDFR